MSGASGTEGPGAGQRALAPRRVVIIGGGITGLAAAYRVLKTSREGGSGARPVEVTLLEGSDHLGGNIRTERSGGLVIDGGPDAFVLTKPHATALCKELGLGDRLIGTIEQNRKVYVLHGGRLHTLPEGMFLTVPTQLLSTARTELLSWAGKARAALDLALPPKAEGEDESIGSFVGRRLGREVAERIADPLLGGIYAGNVDALSIRATFPQLVELEEKYGSLIRGALTQRASRARAIRAQAPGGGEKKRGKSPPPSAFNSLVGGMGELIDTLAERVAQSGGEVRKNTQVESVTRPDADADPQQGSVAAARFLVKTRSPGGALESLPADDVLLALPAYRVADLTCELDPELSALLREIPYESTAIAVLSFPRDAVPHALDASGLIIPKTERRRILAMTFITSKWEHRAPPGTALIRVFLGGHRDPQILEREDAALIDLARSELRDILGVTAEPSLTRVFRYPRGSAQPTVGHRERMARVRRRTALHPGLYLAGGAFDGVGIPDCVRQANEIAKKILEREP